MKPGFASRPRTDAIDGKHWMLVRPLRYVSNDGRVFDVPAGFVTDFASAWFGRWALLPRNAMHSPAAIVHDWLYHVGIVSRSEADRIYREAMSHDNIAPRHQWKAYLGVRIGGWRAWRKHRKAKR